MIDRYQEWMIDRGNQGWMIDRGNQGWMIDRGNQGWNDRQMESRME